MYDYQSLYNSFEPCSSYHEKHPNELPGSSGMDIVVSTLSRNVAEAPFPLTQAQPAAEKRRQKEAKRPVGRLVVDTSAFSVEERLIAAVWVHERKRSKTSMSQIKKDFVQRFGREPPAKNTLLVWERKLFSSGSVHDAPRPGRPVHRRSKVEEVSASLRTAPSLSMRARAAALRVPRTTLRTILQRDLRHAPNTAKRSPKKCSKKSPPTPEPAVRRSPATETHGYQQQLNCWSQTTFAPITNSL